MNPPTTKLGATKLEALANVRVVLSHTSHPGNIGSAARAMKTMGLNQLALVNPRHFISSPWSIPGIFPTRKRMPFPPVPLMCCMRPRCMPAWMKRWPAA